MMNSLEAAEVCKSYGGRMVVDHISFQAQAGQILGLLGPNGAGKTTTIRMIMGITAPDSGRVNFTYDGQRMEGVPRHLIGYLPEERGLYKDAKVMQLLVFLAGLKNIPAHEAKAKARMWLEKLDLAGYANAKVEQLSKGMAQKIQLIAAIIHEPKYIILDEPFSGLDPVNQDLIKAEIRSLAAQGAVILLSSHQMNIVEELCDQIFLINGGKKVVSGTLREIKENYGSYRVQVESAHGVEQLARLPLIEDVQRLGDTRWVLNLKDGITPEEFLRSIPEGCRFDELQIVRPSLHDIFVKIATGGEKQ